MTRGGDKDVQFSNESLNLEGFVELVIEDMLCYFHLILHFYDI